MIESYQIAAACWEVNRQWIISRGGEVPPPWEFADLVERDSMVEAVWLAKRNPFRTAEENHEAWMAFRLSFGWTYGSVKDTAEKKHPNLVPYWELSPEERVKDHLFLATVQMFMKADSIVKGERDASDGPEFQSERG